MATSTGELFVTQELLQQLISTQEKLAFLEETVGVLNEALVAKERTISSLEQRVEAIESAVRALARKPQGKREEVANAEEDPVPSSG